jgi:hypothetical protein
MKYNAIVRIHYLDEDKKTINLSFVTPDHQEHELDFPASALQNLDCGAIPAEYMVHPACCEHPDGCPTETNTERLLKEFNAKFT